VSWFAWSGRGLPSDAGQAAPAGWDVAWVEGDGGGTPRVASGGADRAGEPAVSRAGERLASWGLPAAVARRAGHRGGIAWGLLLGRPWVMVLAGGCRAATEYRSAGPPAGGDPEAAAVFSFLRDRVEEYRHGRDVFEAARQAVGTALETYESGAFDLVLASRTLLLAVIHLESPVLAEAEGGCLLAPGTELVGQPVGRHPRFGARVMLFAEGDLLADAHV
jgi:hypothetical protein